MVTLRLRGVYPDQIYRISQILGQLDREYPGTLHSVETYSRPGDESLANEDAGVISLNLFWFSKPLLVLQDAFLKGNAISHGVEGVAAWHDKMRQTDHLMYHEFAHCLRTKIGTKALQFARNGHQDALKNPEIAATGYALVDPEEWWSETFAALKCGREHAWAGPQAQSMKAFLEAQ